MDGKFVMEKVGMGGKLSFGFHGKSSDNEKVVRYYRGLGKTFIRELYELYKDDFEIFGYTVSEWLWVHLDDE